jgi:hypothetical protein
MSDEMDFEEQMNSRKNAIRGRMRKCNRCGMLDTFDGECPFCHKGKMIQI